MVVCVTFFIRLKDEANAAKFLENFKTLQAHCWANEPGTTCYELHECFCAAEESPDGKPHPIPFAFLVIERYNSQRDLQEVHFKSDTFAAFFASLAHLAVEEQKLNVYENADVQAKLNAMAPPAQMEAPKQDIMKKGILVFAGARAGASPLYVQAAEALGHYIATTARRPLVYGGGTVGVMGTIAQTVQKEKGMVVAIIPKALQPREASGEMIGDLIYYTDTMSERKSIMFTHADTVIALPGGIGTFDELLEVMTLFQLNAYRPRIGVCNVNNFFAPFLQMLENLVKEGFLEATTMQCLVVRDTVEELVAALEDFKPPVSAASALIWNGRP